MSDLQEIIENTTVAFRKGDPVTVKNDGAVQVIEIFAMEHEDLIDDEVTERVDVHFMVVGVNRAVAQRYRRDLVEWLDEYPDQEQLSSGPSYIHVGAEIGSQDAALRLFALGKVLGLWDIITPEVLGMTGDDADRVAGQGFVMITGYKQEAVK